MFGCSKWILVLGGWSCCGCADTVYGQTVENEWRKSRLTVLCLDSKKNRQEMLAFIYLTISFHTCELGLKLNFEPNEYTKEHIKKRKETKWGVFISACYKKHKPFVFWSHYRFKS